MSLPYRTGVKVIQPQPFREISVTCPESSCVLPGEVAGGVFAAARRAGALYCSAVCLPFTDRYSYAFISHKCVLACRFRRPRGLRRGSAGARFLGLRVRIPREASIVQL